MAILTDANYVDKAEQTIKKLDTSRYSQNPNRYYFKLTTSKIRSLLASTSHLYDESNTKPFEDLADKIAYLRVQYVYQAGREFAVKDLVEKGQILEALKEVRDIDTLQRFCRYMEALVAYFKYYGGND